MTSHFSLPLKNLFPVLCVLEFKEDAVNTNHQHTILQLTMAVYLLGLLCKKRTFEN